MPQLTGLIGRIVYAILVGVVTFLVVYILGAIVVHFETAVGAKIEDFAPLIGLLAGLVTFFVGTVPGVFNRPPQA